MKEQYTFFDPLEMPGGHFRGEASDLEGFYTLL
jgi:hypothetical protein